MAIGLALPLLTVGGYVCDLLLAFASIGMPSRVDSGCTFIYPWAPSGKRQAITCCITQPAVQHLILQRASSMRVADASKSTCSAKPTNGSHSFARRTSRSCSANRLIQCQDFTGQPASRPRFFQVDLIRLRAPT